jgi:hypothetical protein
MEGAHLIGAGAAHSYRGLRYCFLGTGEIAKLFRDNQPGLLAEAVQSLHIKPLTQCRNAG